MSKQIKTLQDLRDSRILYEKDLPYFGYMIILVLTFLLIILAVWMCKTPKMYIVKGNGLVYSTNKNYIMSSYSGEIKEINIKEGAYVEKGTALLTVASIDLDLQKEQVDKQIVTYKDQIAQYEKLLRCLRDNTNYFDSMNMQDDFYRSKYEAYESKRKQLNFNADEYKRYGYTDDQIKEELFGLNMIKSHIWSIF
ncbi:Biotin-lipoyl like [Desulfotomaculum arcticum]|uniref:Biotin-lipoyl like n=1 Tax=Desulfotruncus arcticus DSM 17038 TaxID=1121424 RepID=A0A1I2WN55_9FIRM|nr:biotin/lipoyl-binding protein [Desulfotruncus arcticus]SFH02107.1 Biotin-lipoyl like [Desulfotomaculum arcticum] [Desulfotruncus arcticus DSM 17038]